MNNLIHEHKGMRIYRTPEGILRVAHKDDGDKKYKINLDGIKNTVRGLTLMKDSGYVPKLISAASETVLTEDLGKSEGVKGYTAEDWQNLRRELVSLLIKLRQRNYRHGDLSGGNIIIKDKKPYIIDWQESHFLNEDPPQTRPFSDTHFVCQNLIRWIGNADKSDPYRIVRRWASIWGDLTNGHWGLGARGKSLLDIGCFQGDFCAFAASEKMTVTGIDVGTFRHDEDSIGIGKSIWPHTDNMEMLTHDVMRWDNFKYDVVLFMDTFPYIIREAGKERAIQLLKRIVNEAGVVYFEAQMWGDRSGIEWLKTDEDVKSMVDANWIKIGTFKEGSVPRTLWKITR